MKSQQYQQLAETEAHHWWHRSRQALAAGYLDRMALKQPVRILDVGCGTGGTTRFLLRYGSVIGLDRSQQGLAHARRKAPAATLVQGDANRLAELFAPTSFDLITFFNVLYHQWITDDQAIISATARLLRPGGRLLLTEPAFDVLMRRHDRLDMGKQRYRMQDFKRFFENAGLRFEAGQYFNALAVPVCLALALTDRWRADGDDDDQASAMAVPAEPINALLWRYMALESSVLRTLQIPLGVTLLAIARKS